MTAQQQYVTTVFPQGFITIVEGAPRVAPVALRPAPVPVPRRIGAADVLGLLEAAGPLTTADIAGGLGVSEREAASVVRVMLDRDWLRPDEWGRLGVGRGAPATLAA
jgi:hypothetical protein